MKVLFLTQLSDDRRQYIASKFPQLDFIFSSREGVTQDEVNDCDVLVGNPRNNVKLNSAKMKAMFLNSAGSDRYIGPGVLNENTKLANATGAHSRAMAEHTIGMILAMNKNFQKYFANMQEHGWHNYGGGKEIINSTVMIVGLGDIGYNLARRLKAFDCKIVGVKRSISPVPDYIDELYTVDQLDEVLPQADYVISCLPHTPATIHIFNYERMSLMKDDATLVNIGRGSAVASEDLKKVLDEGKFHSVCLDVTEPEPLDPESSLWDYERVFITPHVSGNYYWMSAQDYFTDLVIKNLTNFIEEKPFINEVDFKTGYAKGKTRLL